MQADSTLAYLLEHDQYIVSPGCSYHAPAETNEITTIRSQCKNVIVETSWKMVFAKDEETFYALKEEMQTTAKSLGYEQVLAFDMENAHNKIKAKQAAAQAQNTSTDTPRKER